MHNFLKIFNVVLFYLLLIGCSSSKKQNVLSLNLRGDPVTLDPRLARDLGSLAVTRTLFDGLVRINKAEKAELSIAETVDISSDETVYTFVLKPTVWSNGKAVTAQDFVYAWKKVLTPEFPSSQAFHLYVIKNGRKAKEGKISFDQVGIKALDERTLQVELEHPVPYFLDLIALPVFFPIPENSDEAGSGDPCHETSFVGNGPFMLNSWKHSDVLKVKKNPTYWDADQVKLGGIDFFMVEEASALAMFRRGELDWVGSPLCVIPVDAIERLKQEGILQRKPFLATYFIRINTEAAPFQKPLMRRAFGMGINRSEIVDHVMRGGQQAATQFLPPSFGTHPYFIDGNVELARNYFAEGLKELEGEELPVISFLYPAGERTHLMAQVLQDQWYSTFGVSVKLCAVERKVFFDRLAKGSFQLAAGSWFADFNDEINFLEIFKFKEGGSNSTAWDNVDYRHLLDKALKSKERKERKEIFDACEEILMKEMPIIPIYHPMMVYVLNKKIKDVILLNFGTIDFKWAYLDIPK